MARLCFTLVILAILALVVSQVESQTCKSQTFKNKRVYANCTDLPYLNAFLHWTYNYTESILDMAFIAPPPNPKGWIAWAINPVGPTMISSQALLGYKNPDNIPLTTTYNISSYNPKEWGDKLSYDAWDFDAEEYINGNLVIFGKWKLPEKTEKVYHVWQVGPGIVEEKYLLLPFKHAMNPQNKNSKGILQLVGI